MYFLTRRYQIRLETAITGWTTAGKETHTVSVRPETVRRSHCDYAIRIARISNTESGVTIICAFLSLKALVAVIPGGRYHHHSTLDQVLALIANRRATTREIPHVVRYRQAEISAMNG